MPDRIIRAGILTSERVDRLSWAAEVFYRRLMSVVDDFGRYDGRPSILRAGLYPLKLDQVKESDIETWICECVEAGLLRQYCHERKPFVEILNFGQRLRAAKSRWPAPDGDSRSSADICQQVTSDCEHLSANDDGCQTEPDKSFKNALADICQQVTSGRGQTLTNATDTESDTNTEERGASVSLSPFEIYRSIYGEQTLIYNQEAIEAAGIDDLDLWRQCVTDWKTNHYSVRNVSGLIRSYGQRKEREAKMRLPSGADEVVRQLTVVAAPPEWGKNRPRERMPEDVRASLQERRAH